MVGRMLCEVMLAFVWFGVSFRLPAHSIYMAFQVSYSLNWYIEATTACF